MLCSRHVSKRQTLELCLKSLLKGVLWVLVFGVIVQGSAMCTSNLRAHAGALPPLRWTFGYFQASACYESCYLKLPVESPDVLVLRLLLGHIRSRDLQLWELIPTSYPVPVGFGAVFLAFCLESFCFYQGQRYFSNVTG